MNESPKDLMRRANPEPDIELNEERKAAIRVKVDEMIASPNGLDRLASGRPIKSVRRGPLVAAAVAVAVIAIVGGAVLMLPDSTVSPPANQPPAPLPETPGPDETPSPTALPETDQPPSATPGSLQVGDSWVESTPFGEARFTVIEPTWFEIEGTLNGFFDHQSSRFSTDLISWVHLEPGSGFYEIQALSDGSFVAFGDGELAISIDTETWSRYTLEETDPRRTFVAPLGGGFYVSSVTGPDLEQEGSDADDANLGYITDQAGGLRFVGETPRFIGVVSMQGTLFGYAGKQVWRSTDGIEWTTLGDAPSATRLRVTPHGRLVIDEEWYSDDGIDWELGHPSGMGFDLIIGTAGLVVGPDHSLFPAETWYSRTGAEWTRWESPVFGYARVLAVGDRIVIGSYRGDGPDPREIVIVVEAIE